MINKRQFKKATGFAPVQDDLERCNCRKAGQPGHMSCGWNKAKRLPVFMVGS